MVGDMPLDSVMAQIIFWSPYPRVDAAVVARVLGRLALVLPVAGLEVVVVSLWCKEYEVEAVLYDVDALTEAIST